MQIDLAYASRYIFAAWFLSVYSGWVTGTSFKKCAICSKMNEYHEYQEATALLAGKDIMKYKCWNHFCTFWQVLQWSICVVLWDLSTQRTLPRDVFAWYTAQAGILRHTMACVMSHKRKISTRAVTLRAPISHHSAVEALTSAHFVWVVVYAYVSQPSLFWALVDPWRTARAYLTFAAFIIHFGI